MIYITGDTHADLNRFYSPAAKKIKRGDTLIVCGDFGFIWDGGDEELKILKKLSKLKYDILFVDGKHENFDILNKYPVVEYAKGKTHKIAENIYHLIRGNVFNIEDKTIFALGGGESTDKEDRKAADKWWSEEMPNIEEMKYAVSNLNKYDRTVDYIITHEPPTASRNILVSSLVNFNMLDVFLDEIAKQVKYKKWFFGCLHIDRKITSMSYAVFKDIIPIEEVQSKRKFR